MKRILIVLMILMLGLSALSGCKKQVEETEKEKIGFEAPEGYAVALSMKVNPEFRLYLDQEGAVLAIEPLNEDAEWVVDATFTPTGELGEVLEALTAAIKDGGYIEDRAAITLAVYEQKDEKADAKGMLKDAQKAIRQGFEALDLSVKVILEGEEEQPEESAPSKEPQKPAKKPEKKPLSSADYKIVEGDPNAYPEDPVRVEVTKNPTKLVYCAGEPYDATGMEALAIYKDGTARKLGPGQPLGYAAEGAAHMMVEWVLGDGLSLYSAKIPITVKPAVFRIAENPYPTAIKLKVGETYSLRGEFLQGASGSIRWRSNHEEHATVDQNGLVTALSEGTTYIYAIATVNGVDYEATPCRIEIDPAPMVEPTEPIPPSEPVAPDSGEDLPI